MWQDVKPAFGLHQPERDAVGEFCWTQGVFGLTVERTARFAELRLCYHGHDGTLKVSGPRGFAHRVSLNYGWQFHTVPLAGIRAGDAIEFQVRPLVAAVEDERELGVMLRRVLLHDEPRRSELLEQVRRNRALNTEEFRSGAAKLDSFPPLLRVTLESRCNIPETAQACVYCAWDWAKLAERGSPAFSRTSFDEYGQFYEAAAEVGDCSIGEPTMNKDFADIVAQVDRDGKQFSFTTNGQLLTPNRRRALLGKDCVLYVSLDSATAAGYARYRNDRFEDINKNLAALCREKKAHGNLPHVFVSLILMRSNLAELPAYFALMRELDVDEVKLRLLYLDENLPSVVWNNGYRFDYARELLSVDESRTAARHARSLAKECGLPVYIESEQALTNSENVAATGTHAAEDGAVVQAPLCAEPWTSMYALNRGIMPCCYATRPIATWREQGDRTREEFLRDVFNGPTMQEIRSELAAGRLADYCQNTPSCPVLNRQQASGTIAVACNTFQEQVFGSAVQAGALPIVSLEATPAPQVAAL